MNELLRGGLRKLRTEAANPVRYSLPVGEVLLPLNELIGSPLRLEYLGEINCIHCGRKIPKSFAQGYCYPCFRGLAECDSCIVKPEQCHYHLGTCRDEEWARSHCLQPHYIYLANSSGLKVGITRGSQVPTRWMDQGAAQALPVYRVNSRFHSGLVEVAFKEFVGDRTDWRKMLKGEPKPVDLVNRRDDLYEQLAVLLEKLVCNEESFAPELLPGEEVREFRYPVLEYPLKVVSFNLDKLPLVEGVLQGIKGQYLILDKGVLNIRKFGGYSVAISL